MKLHLGEMGKIYLIGVAAKLKENHNTTHNLYHQSKLANNDIIS